MFRSTINEVSCGNEADGKLRFMHFNGIQWILIAGSNCLKMRFDESFLEHLDMVLGRELRRQGYLKPLHNTEPRKYPQVSKPLGMHASEVYGIPLNTT